VVGVVHFLGTHKKKKRNQQLNSPANKREQEKKNIRKCVKKYADKLNFII